LFAQSQDFCGENMKSYDLNSFVQMRFAVLRVYVTKLHDIGIIHCRN